MSASPTQETIWIAIVGMAVLNYAVRFVPMAIVSRISLPDPVARWLSFIPVSVMGALVASEVLRPEGSWSNPLLGANLYAAIVTGLVFRFTRSFLGATVAGMASYVLLQHVAGLPGR